MTSSGNDADPRGSGVDPAKPADPTPDDNAKALEKLDRLLKDRGIEDPTVLAEIRQIVLSVQRHEHHYPHEMKSMAEAAEVMERVKSGAGARFLDALNADFETQTTMQHEEQTTQRRLAYLGFVGGWIFTAGLIAAALVCVWLDYPWIAGAFIGAASASIVRDFVRAGDRDRPS